VAVTLRLARFGRTHSPHYRVVVSEKVTKRDGKFIERLGNYFPLREPAEIILKEDRVRHWLAVGAQTTDLVRSIIIKKIPGLMEDIEKNRLSKLQAARKKRKERLKAGASNKGESKKVAKKKK
jgi:small subunit ribosomal protein S16